MKSSHLIEELVNRFAESVVAQRKARDADSGNIFAKQYISAFETLTHEYGDEGRESLSALLRHPDLGVRGMAAAFLLRYKHSECMEVLEELTAR